LGSLCTLWGWAILHKAVTPIEIDMLYALIAAAHRTRTGLPGSPGTPGAFFLRQTANIFANQLGGTR